MPHEAIQALIYVLKVGLRQNFPINFGLSAVSHPEKQGEMWGLQLFLFFCSSQGRNRPPSTPRVPAVLRLAVLVLCGKDGENVRGLGMPSRPRVRSARAPKKWSFALKKLENFYVS